MFLISHFLKRLISMARGTRTAGDDDTWRPSAEDVDVEVYDEMLDEETVDEVEPQKKRRASPRASPVAQQKKASHRPKRQDDDTYTPADEELEDEEIEVQEMVNDQLMDEELLHEKPKKKTSSKTPASRKKPAARAKHQEDDTWDPAGDSEELDDEEPEYETPAEEDEDSVDEKPTAKKQTSPKKSRKRPAASSAGSPEQHKTTKPVGGLVPNRLTTATNKKPPEFLVQGQNAKAPFTFAAYRGEGMCMLAMNWKTDSPPEDFVGFAIEFTEPQSNKCQYYSVLFLLVLSCFQLVM